MGSVDRVKVCETCDAYVEPSALAPGAPGSCHRNPPNLVVLVGPKGQRPGSGFPPVQPSEWCSQWKARETTSEPDA